MTDSPQVYLCEVKTGEGVKYYLTVLPPEVIHTEGLRPEAVVGVLLRPPVAGEGVTPGNFARNTAFVRFMHDVIARHGVGLPQCVAEAQQMGVGRIYVVDGRADPRDGAEVSPEDVIGAFRVEGGEVVAGSYQANENHVIISERGFFRLPPEICGALMGELRSKGKSSG